MTPIPIVHLKDFQQRPRVLGICDRWKNQRKHHWFFECFAETLGVFIFVYLGLGSTAGLVIGNIAHQPLSSPLQIGLAYAMGILIALVVCAPTSGGHLNPCMTIACIVYKGFPPLKGVRYIVAQTFGAYLACVFVYLQWREFIVAAEETLITAGTYQITNFTPNGPAGILAVYLHPGQTLGHACLNEWLCCMVIGVVIWASLDPTNPFIPPPMGPVLVSLTYGTVIWSFAIPGVALNSARDVGARLFVLCVYGVEATGGKYAAITALTNIPATLLGVLIYELLLTDSGRGHSKKSHLLKAITLASVLLTAVIIRSCMFSGL